MSNIFHKYQEKKKKRTLKILSELAKRIRSGNLVIEGVGFWDTRTANRVIFQFTLVSRDSEQEIRDFEEL